MMLITMMKSMPVRENLCTFILSVMFLSSVSPSHFGEMLLPESLASIVGGALSHSVHDEGMWLKVLLDSTPSSNRETTSTSKAQLNKNYAIKGKFQGFFNLDLFINLLVFDGVVRFFYLLQFLMLLGVRDSPGSLRFFPLWARFDAFL